MSRFTLQERTVIRGLAQRVAELAAAPRQAELVRLWKAFNACHAERPMVLCFPEHGWGELITGDAFVCQQDDARRIEHGLCRRLYQTEVLADDHPLTAVWHVPVAVRFGDLGLKETRIGGGHGGNDAWRWEPPLKTAADVDKLHIRSVEVDWDATECARAEAEELLGDILNVRVDHSPIPRAQFGRDLILLRGNEQLMYDMYDNPRMLHDILEVLTASALHEIDVLQREGAYRVNNKPDDYCGTGGVGCTDELPSADFDGGVRAKDMWATIENQEFAGFGPRQLVEFALKYNARIAERAGLVYYGCCEAVHDAIDELIDLLPNLRGVSIAPWCDREIAARKLQDRYLYYYKPNPALICAPTAQWGQADAMLRETLDIARGCNVAMVMKDTHTFAGDASRPARWVKLARQAVEDHLAVR
jgi:hypothetical protein